MEDKECKSFKKGQIEQLTMPNASEKWNKVKTEKCAKGLTAQR